MLRRAVIGATLGLLGCGASPVDEALDALEPLPTDYTGPEILVELQPELLILNAQGWMNIGQDGDSACPRRELSESGDKVVLSGGCTDRNGLDWFGEATFTYPDQTGWSPVQPVRYRSGGFGYENGDVAVKIEVLGDLTIDEEGLLDVALMYRIVVSGEEQTRRIQRYSGEVVEVTGGLRWNVEGEIGFDALGKVRVQTEDMVQTEECPFEPESGTTTAWWADGVKATVTYNGIDMCDGQAPWTLNGESRGLLTVRTR